jgi:hypothetical protein
MALALTAEQETKVQRGRRNDTELPEYYDATLQRNLRITRDFEAYLILTEPALKESSIRWINQVVSLQQAQKDRDDLSALALQKELANAQAKVTSLDGRLSGFDEFRKNFRNDPVFANIPEVQKFIFDLQRVVEDLSVQRERAQFDATVSQVIERDTSLVAVTGPEIEQLQSWRSVLAEYLRG